MTMTGALESTMVRISPTWRPKARANHLICHIDASALAGIVFVIAFVYLLGFLTPRNICTGGVSIQTPKAYSPVPMRAVLKEDALNVAIMRDHKVFFRDEQVYPEDLAAKIRQGVRQGAEPKVYIRADVRAKYAWVKQVLDAVQASGVRNIGFLVDQRVYPNSAP